MNTRYDKIDPSKLTQCYKIIRRLLKEGKLSKPDNSNNYYLEVDITYQSEFKHELTDDARNFVKGETGILSFQSTGKNKIDLNVYIAKKLYYEKVYKEGQLHPDLIHFFDTNANHILYQTKTAVVINLTNLGDDDAKLIEKLIKFEVGDLYYDNKTIRLKRIVYDALINKYTTYKTEQQNSQTSNNNNSTLASTSTITSTLQNLAPSSSQNSKEESNYQPEEKQEKQNPMKIEFLLNTESSKASDNNKRKAEDAPATAPISSSALVLFNQTPQTGHLSHLQSQVPSKPSVSELIHSYKRKRKDENAAIAQYKHPKNTP